MILEKVLRCLVGSLDFFSYHELMGCEGGVREKKRV